MIAVAGLGSIGLAYVLCWLCWVRSGCVVFGLVVVRFGWGCVCLNWVRLAWLGLCFV